MILLEEYLEEKTHVIWDWNGTLLNDIDLSVSITSEMMGEFGLPPLLVERHREVFRLPIRDYYHQLGFELTPEEFTQVAHDFQGRYRNRVAECSLFAGAEELLVRLKNKNKHLAILSAANEVDLVALTNHFQITKYFDHVCGLSDIYAVSKIERGFELIKMWGVDRRQVMMIGDMDHDLEVAKALGIDALALADGHQHHSRMNDHAGPLLLCRYGTQKSLT
jgi:phosphoglycolate phosphatase